MSEDVFEMTFAEIEGLKPGEWIKKIIEWMEKAGKKMGEFEVNSVTLNIAAPPSASITFAKAKGGTKAIPASDKVK